MAYDENLAERIRVVLKDRPAVTERKMFGGLAFLVAGNMACGILGEDLMLRLGEDGRRRAGAHAADGLHRPPHEVDRLRCAGRVRSRARAAGVGGSRRSVRPFAAAEMTMVLAARAVTRSAGPVDHSLGSWPW
jgi:hypothetical protein